MRHINYIFFLILSVSILSACEAEKIEPVSSNKITVNVTGVKNGSDPDTRGGIVLDKKISENLSLIAYEEFNDGMSAADVDTKGSNTTTSGLHNTYGPSGLGVFAEISGTQKSVLIDNSKLFYYNDTWSFLSSFFWPEEASDFYSWAPYDAASLSLDDKSFTFTNTSSNLDQVDLLVSDKMSFPASYNEPVDIVYNHALCEVNFEAGETLFNGKMSSLKISGLYMTGIYDFEDGSWRIPEDAESGSITLDHYYPEKITGGKAITDDSQIFFVIPQKSTSETTVELTCKPDGSEEYKTFTVNIPEGFEFKKGSVITFVLSEDGDFELTFVDSEGQEIDTINLTYDMANNEDTKTFNIISSYSSSFKEIPVSYIPEFSVDGGETWHDYSTEFGVTGLTGINAGSVEAKEISLKLKTSTQSTYTKPGDNAVADNWDLSRMEIGGGGDGTGQQNSSNCYIVKHKGTYKFPCVYGNSLQNGALTDAGYKSTVSSVYEGFQMDTFLNAFGEPITNGNIITDVQNYIEDFDPSNLKAFVTWTTMGPLLADVSYSDGYISFSLSSLYPGTAQIVLYYDGLPVQYMTGDYNVLDDYVFSTDTKVCKNGRYDEGEALWSWIIWTTGVDLGIDTVGAVDGGDNNGIHKFMCQDLGTSNSSGHYVRRYVKYPDMKIRLKQSENPSSDYIYINISANEYVTPPTLTGDYLYFTWGRMTPFHYQGLKSSNFLWDGTGGYTNYYPQNGQLFASGNKAKDIGNEIRYTRIWQSNGASYGYVNSWDLNLYVSGISGSGSGNEYLIYYERYSKKTVYDPCPYGYVVPTLTAYGGTRAHAYYRDEVSTLDGKKGLAFYSDPEMTNPINSLFWQFNGYFMALYDHGIKSYDYGAYYWSSTSEIYNPDNTLYGESARYVPSEQYGLVINLKPYGRYLQKFAIRPELEVK